MKRSAFCPACGRHILRASDALDVEQTCKGCGAGLEISIDAGGVDVKATARTRENAGRLADARA